MFHRLLHIVVFFYTIPQFFRLLIYGRDDVIDLMINK